MFRCVSRRSNVHFISAFGPANGRGLASNAPSPSYPRGSITSLNLDPNPDQVVVNESAKSKLNAAGIGFPREATPLRVKDRSGTKYPISVQIASRHVFHRWSLKYFDNFEHPWQQVLLKRLLDLNSQPLWCRCYSQSADRAIVRRKGASLLQHLWRTALQKRGYDPTGRKVQSAGDGQKNGEGIKCLYGTVYLTTQDPLKLVNTPHAQLFQYVEAILEKVEATLGRTDSDKSTTLPPVAQRRYDLARPKKTSRKKPVGATL
ncbi:hypothetical protein NKR23_g1680 [Pleurostoma richardsiae]|uniref:Uncharacterized protein n=1 Tax=Pleurostoma richardsiae TaxID=41990 RepID=A0AA38RR79_9PEZI|nr:hypothetical protein NKR23_g1680 [Pleurostoma richardsiae]